jgi:LacI family transcriptional regulator
MSRRRREINIFKIAEEAGVSTSTVSRVINNRSEVNEDTRLRVNAVLKKYGFTPDYPRQRSPKIAFLTPWDDFMEYSDKAFLGVSQYCREHDVEVGIVIRSRRREKYSLLQQLRDHECSGVISILAEHLHGEQLELGDSGMPVIFLDAPMPIPSTGFIDHDAYSGSCLATQHLLELGHRRIGYLRYAPASINQVQRFKGYENTMKGAGVAIDERWIVDYHAKKTAIRHAPGYGGLMAMKELLAQAPEITAVMAVDDNLAFGAMTAIHESGRRIPDDISVVGFDNALESEIWYPALTTVNHPIEKAGFLAAKSISEAILKTGSEWIPPKEILPTELVIRRSTAAPRTRP